MDMKATSTIRLDFSFKMSQHICFADFIYRRYSWKGNKELVLHLMTDGPFNTFIFLSSFELYWWIEASPLGFFRNLIF